MYKCTFSPLDVICRGGLFELAVDDNAKHTNDNTVCNCREHRQVVPTNDSHIV